MKNKEVIVLIGIPASGKSTWTANFLSKNPNYVSLSRDNFRKMLKNNYLVEPKTEKLITELFNSSLISSLNNGYSVIIDNTNLSIEVIKNIVELVKYKANIRFVHLEISKEKAIARDLERDKSVGKDVIERMYAKLQILYDQFDFMNIDKVSLFEQTKTMLNNRPKYNPENQDAVIFDLDGTLFLTGDRDIYDETKVEKDILNDIVYQHLNFWKETKKIIIVTGRSEEYIQYTRHALKRHKIHYDLLLCRSKNDTRKDYLVKKDLYENNLMHRYNIFVIYDDRNSVVDYWRSLNIPTFQVNNGNF